jgi:predicted dehydrogenase
VHPLSIVLLAAAPARPVAVRATIDGSRTGAHPSDEHAEVRLRFDSGLEATVVSSWRGGPVPSWTAQAASASSVVQLELNPTITLERMGEPIVLPAATVEPPQVEGFGYVEQLRALLALDRRSTAMTVDFGRHVLDIVCAAYWSAGPCSGEWVELPFAGPRNRTPLELWRS